MALKQPLVAIALWAYVRVAAAETITWEATVEAGPGRALVGHGGRVSVSVVTGADGEDIQSIEFLDDVTLRYLDDMRKPPGTHTHEVTIRKGSVLRLAQ